MDEHLGYEKSERSGNDDYRNGYKRKQVNSHYGSMEIRHSLVSRTCLCCSAEFYGMQGAVFIGDSQPRLDSGVVVAYVSHIG